MNPESLILNHVCIQLRVVVNLNLGRAGTWVLQMSDRVRYVQG